MARERMWLEVISLAICAPTFLGSVILYVLCLANRRDGMMLRTITRKEDYTEFGWRCYQISRVCLAIAVPFGFLLFWRLR